MNRSLIKIINFSIIIVCIFLLLAVKGIYFNSKRVYKIPLSYGVILTHINVDLHTISYFSKQYNGEIRLLRGKIEGYKVVKEFLIGFLNTSQFQEQNLVKYKENNDKNGYFYINMEKKTVFSGLSKEEFKKVLKEVLKIEEEQELKNLSPYNLNRFLGLFRSN